MIFGLAKMFRPVAKIFSLHNNLFIRPNTIEFKILHRKYIELVSKLTTRGPKWNFITALYKNLLKVIDYPIFESPDQDRSTPRPGFAASRQSSVVQQGRHYANFCFRPLGSLPCFPPPFQCRMSLRWENSNLMLMIAEWICFPRTRVVKRSLILILKKDQRSHNLS